MYDWEVISAVPSDSIEIPEIYKSFLKTHQITNTTMLRIYTEIKSFNMYYRIIKLKEGNHDLIFQDNTGAKKIIKYCELEDLKSKGLNIGYKSDYFLKE